MCLHLDDLTETAPLPEGYTVASWEASRLEEVSRVDFEAYRGTLDAALYWRYFTTPSGCERMWREGVAGKFGRFDAERTLVLLRGGRACGCVMASVRLPGDAFIGDLAVHPDHRGGTGRALLLECLWRYRRAGFRRVHLAVTLDNAGAYHLYQRLGFRATTRFPVIVRPPRRLLRFAEEG